MADEEIINSGGGGAGSGGSGGPNPDTPTVPEVPTSPEEPEEDTPTTKFVDVNKFVSNSNAIVGMYEQGVNLLGE